MICFFEFLTPFILRAIIFSIFISILMIFSALDKPIGGVQVLFIHKKQWNPPFGISLPWMLKYYSCNSITTNEQLKDLTYMSCFRIPCYKLYKEGLFSYVLTLKYMCHFLMNFKKFNLKAKHKIKKKNSWLFFRLFNFVFSYLLTYLGK